MFRRGCLILILLLAACCTRQKFPFPRFDAINASEGAFRVHYQFIDIPAERRIEIRFHNDLGQPVCIDDEQWPGGGGFMRLGTPGMTLVIGKKRFQAEETTGEFCPGCAHYVLPGETLRASIPYKLFHLPEALYNKKKQLDFHPMGYRCIKRN